MRKFFASVFVVAAMLATACSSQQGSVTAPSPVAAVASTASAGVHANLTAPMVSDACKPPTNSVVFDATQLGRVTITNNSTCTNEFLYVVWSVSPNDEANQGLLAAQGARLAPGERRQLTLNFPEVCGTKYQRDVYIGLSDDKPNYSYSDMGNYFFAALGYYQYSPRCDAPPSNPNTPPVDVCPNLEGNQASMPQGFALVEGACVQIVNPPADVCPNIEGNQASVPAGLALVGGLCVPFVPPPVDVCPNLEGNQASVPAGYTLVGGSCVPTPPAVDVCPNLDGIQSTVPAGYTLVGGLCVVVPPPPAVCTDATATNFGGPLPCSYAPPPAPSCGSVGLNGAIGPLTVDVPNGAGRLTYVRSLDPAFGGIVEVHPSHGGTFGGSNSTGFTFTSAGDYAVLIFHHMGGGNLDLVFIGVHTGDVLSVPTNGGDVFYFSCPQ